MYLNARVKDFPEKGCCMPTKIINRKYTHFDSHLSILLCSECNRHTCGALDGGSQCCMSILRNYHVPCHYSLNCHADFKTA